MKDTLIDQKSFPAAYEYFKNSQEAVQNFVTVNMAKFKVM